MLILNCMDCYSKRGAASVTDRTDQEFLGPIGTVPPHLHIFLHFSSIFLPFPLFLTASSISPFPSNAHVRNPNPCQFFPLTFSPTNVLLKNCSNTAACQMAPWSKKVHWLPAHIRKKPSPTKFPRQSQ